MIEVWRWNEGDPWDLTVEAPGLGQSAWEHRFDLFGLLVSQRRNAGPNWRNGAWTKIIRMRQSDRVPLPCFWRLGIEMPDAAKVRMHIAGRSVPMPVNIEITDDLLWLLGLWVAEGSRHDSAGNAFLTLCCDNLTLDRAARIIEHQLGLHVVRAAASEARAAGILIHSKLLLQLMEFLGFDETASESRVGSWGFHSAD